tara:strand:- start:57 stop:467 length:411 start_codon:yes stop_codon:yes gene_type:complete
MSEYSIEELQKMLDEKIAEEKQQKSKIIEEIKLNFDINDIINTYTLHHTKINGMFSRYEQINKELFDDSDNLKMDVVNKYVDKYINDWVLKKQYGENYSLEDIDIGMNITWDVNLKVLKNTTEIKQKVKPKLKKLS